MWEGQECVRERIQEWEREGIKVWEREKECERGYRSGRESEDIAVCERETGLREKERHSGRIERKIKRDSGWERER